MRQGLSKILLIICLFICSQTSVQAEDETFYIEEIKADGSTVLLDQAESYTVAQASYDAHVANTNNIQIRQGDTIWKMKYGVVLFNTTDTCDYNVTYFTENGSGYTNGCYGIDAAYVGSSTPGYLDFVISGVYGSTTGDDVSLMPIETAKQVSSFSTADGKLYHQIKTDMNQSTYSSLIYLGDAPAYLEDGKEYYSYDTHYFYPVNEDYSGFHQMIDDLSEHTHAHAVNADEPFYQYYQYLSHRSETAYSADEIDTYFNDYLQINSPLTGYRSIQTSYHAILTQSLLKDSGTAFLQYQNEFGANALMMLALSMNESAVGRSYLAYTRNNLFGHAAFDSAVEENASRYHSIDASIYSHAYHYLHKGYANPDNYVWHGGYFGNKASGMNVMYASDPYWGEKAAQYLVRLDEALGNKDKNQYTLGMIKGDHNVSFYQAPSTDSEEIYNTQGLSDFAVILLDEAGDFYQIQSEAPLAQDHGYDFDNSVAYVKKSDIDLLSKPLEAKSSKRYPITFDAQGGTFENQESKLTLMLKENQMPAVVPPIKEGWLFSGWDKEIQPVSEAATYTAQYAEISNVALTKLPKQQYEAEEQLDVQDGMMEITLAQGEKRQIPLNSAMISGFDNEKTGKQTLRVTYQGASCEYEIEIQESKKEQQSAITQQIETLLKQTNGNEELDDAAKEQILQIKQTMDEQGIADFNIGSYRAFDQLLQKAYGSSLRIIVNDDDSDISVSGLSIAAPLDEPAFFPQSIRLSFSKGVAAKTEDILKKVAQGNNYTLDYCFSIDVKKGSQPLTLQEELIYALPITNESKVNRQYMILIYDEGDVIQLPLEQSADQIRFLSDHVGDFALVYRNSTATYDQDDSKENNSVLTNPHSVWDYLIILLAGCLILLLIIITVIIRKKRKPGSGNKPKQAKQRKRKKQKQPKQKKQQKQKNEQVQQETPTDQEAQENEPIHYFRNQP